MSVVIQGGPPVNRSQVTAQIGRIFGSPYFCDSPTLQKLLTYLVEQALEGHEVHIHVPAGAIPKDGPSAGVTMVTAIASLLTGRPVKSTIGMTGEVTLQGRVLPIGGLKQKVLAAHAAGLTEVILPERNRYDLDDVPAEIRDTMRFHIAGSVDQVLELALEPRGALANAA